jgi:large-conductance mechanosensitive channel
MASPSYRIDVVALAVAAVLAAAIVFLASQVVPDLTDLMMMPPPLSGAH